MARQVTFICGPPCSGKTTLARQLAAPGDLVIDRDLYAQEYGSPRTHMHPPEFTRRAEQRMRTELAKLTYTDNATAWVVRSLPRQEDRDTEAQRLGATVRLLDPGMGECIRRARHDNRPKGTVSSIRQWYAKATAPPIVGSPCMDCGQPASSVRCKACCERLRNGRPWRRLQDQVFTEEHHCWICGHWVDQTLHRDHPKSRTADHVWALRDGGPPLDRDNVHLAHRDCNTARTNRARARGKDRGLLIVDASTI